MELTSAFQETDLGRIPADWTVKPLGAIGEALIGLTYAPSDVSRDGVLVLRSSNVQDGSLRFDDNVFVQMALPERLMVKDGDILICVRNGSRNLIGKAALLDERAKGMTFGAFMAVFRTPFSTFVYQQFTSGLLKRQIDEHLGATINQITNKSLNSFRIPFPEDEHEREVITTALSDADVLVGALDRLIAKKRDLTLAVMQQLVTGQIRLPGFDSSANKRTESGAPVDWEVRPLLSALRVATGQVDPRIEPYRSMTLVAPDHVESATGRLLARQSAADQKAISGKYLFRAGDVIYSKIRPYLRKAIVAEFDGLCSADMYPLRPAAGVSARYMLAVLLGHRFSTFAESVSVRSGMPKINRAELAEYSVALPRSEEQDAIASVLTDMDSELAALERRRDKIRLLKQGMAQELLTGRTRLV